MDNLKEFLQLCANLGDTDLKERLENCVKNAMYSSKTAQNDLLECIKVFLQQKIVTRVKNQEHIYAFGIQADEVIDVSNCEQLGCGILKRELPWKGWLNISFVKIFLETVLLRKFYK
jgi:hypothetical protein